MYKVFSKYYKSLFFFLFLFFPFSISVAEDVSNSATENLAENSSIADSASETEKKGEEENNKSSDKVKTEEVKTVINIESAQKTEYKKDVETNEDCLVLTGNVSISVTKGNDTTKVKASIINYNRATNMLYAYGSVEVQIKGSSSDSDTVTAESLLLNTSTLEGVFDNGRIVQASSDAINLPSGSTLIVMSDIFGKNSTGTIVFKTGELTFCDDDEPHWKIKASRIWLLPGGEFAFLNARIFVGSIPLLYLPAFYYPKDELLFHPVFGYDNRKGYFMQTTTYLYGRKGVDSSSSDDDDSYFSFINTGTLKNQVREGLVLHNLDSNFEGSTSNYFKILGDYYSNLGWMTGFDTSYTASESNLSKFAMTGLIAQSNSIFLSDSGSIYTTAAPKSTNVLTKGESYTDKSYFLGYEIPFRFKTNLELSISKPFTFSLSLPTYSDPYFEDDFITDRSETMDWIDYLMTSSSTTSDDDDDDDDTAISSFEWNLSASYKFPLPDIFSPWISTVSITSLTSSVTFTAVTNGKYSDTSSGSYDSLISTYSPERMFFYPSTVTPLKFSANIAGTLLQFPKKSSDSKSKNVEIKFPYDLTIPDSFAESDVTKNAIEDANTLADGSPIPEDAEKELKDADTKDKKEEKFELSDSDLPNIEMSALSTKTLEGLTYALSYTIKPSYTTQITYANPSSSDEFDWNEIKASYYNFTSPTVVTSKLSYDSSLFTVQNIFTFNPVFQAHPYLNITENSSTGYTTSSAATVKKADYNARKLDLTNTNQISYKPFLYTPYFYNSGVTWNSTVKIIRTEFIGDAENPEWEYLTTDLSDEDCVTVHTLSVALAANESDNFSQTLTLTSTLPPQTDEYSGTLALVFPHLTLNFATGIEQDEDDSSVWIKQDFQQSAAISFLSGKLKFTESFNYDLEESYADSMKLAFTFYDLQLAYTMSYTYGYYMDYDENDNPTGWVAESEKEFQPYSFSLAYAKSSKTYRYWRNRISYAPALSTSIVYDCLRPTNSYFSFVPSITFKINDFLDITFSSESKNSVIYRYFQDYTGSNLKLSGENNIIKDLIDSFRFDDDSKREASGFKLKSLKLSLTHDLHDWDLSSSLTIKPRLVTGSDSTKYYSFSPYFTLSVVWRPMSSMKTEIVDEYGEWELNP